MDEEQAGDASAQPSAPHLQPSAPHLQTYLAARQHLAAVGPPLDGLHPDEQVKMEALHHTAASYASMGDLRPAMALTSDPVAHFREQYDRHLEAARSGYHPAQLAADATERMSHAHRFTPEEAAAMFPDTGPSEKERIANEVDATRRSIAAMVHNVANGHLYNETRKLPHVIHSLDAATSRNTATAAEIPKNANSRRLHDDRTGRASLIGAKNGTGRLGEMNRHNQATEALGYVKNETTQNGQALGAARRGKSAPDNVRAREEAERRKIESRLTALTHPTKTVKGFGKNNTILYATGIDTPEGKQEYNSLKARRKVLENAENISDALPPMGVGAPSGTFIKGLGKIKVPAAPPLPGAGPPFRLPARTSAAGLGGGSLNGLPPIPSATLPPLVPHHHSQLQPRIQRGSTQGQFKKGKPADPDRQILELGRKLMQKLK